MKHSFSLFVWALLASAFAAKTPSEISVTITPSFPKFILGERMLATIDVANRSADVIDCRTNTSPDRLLVELSRASDHYPFEKVSDEPFTKGFALLSGEGQQLETFLGDHFPFHKATRYFVRAVLVHAGMRYESALKTIDVVPGIKCGSALQIFASRADLKRQFELVYWERAREQHLFLKAHDTGTFPRAWPTYDLGSVLRVTEPKLSVLPSGEVVVLHRASLNSFIRSEFWSLPGVFEFHTHEIMMDPDVAGAERMKEVYRESGELKPVKKTWWKFW